jgi:hypothetical protein
MAAHGAFRLSHSDSNSKKLHPVTVVSHRAFKTRRKRFTLFTPRSPEFQYERFVADEIGEVYDTVVEVVDLDGRRVRSAGDSNLVLRGCEMSREDEQTEQGEKKMR